MKLRLVSMLSLLLLGCLSFGRSALADHVAEERVFGAVLSGRGEVPAGPSPARGVATFLLSADDSQVHYALTVSGATSAVVAAHVHLGSEFENGPIVVSLCTASTTPCLTEGLVAHGSITASALVENLAGQPLSALVERMRGEQSYVNVHTGNFPDGEVRGQIIGADVPEVDEERIG